MLGIESHDRLAVTLSIALAVLAGAGIANGARSDPEAPPEPPRSQRRRLADLRVGGHRNVPPPEDVRQRMREAGQHELTAVVKLCIGVDGVPTTTKVVSRSGDEGSDAFVVRQIRAWRFLPVWVNGMPTPVCSRLLFKVIVD